MILGAVLGVCIGSTCGARTLNNVCEAFFSYEPKISFSRADISSMFFHEYDAVTARDVRLTDRDVRIMSDRSPLFALKEFKLEDEQIVSELKQSDQYARLVLLPRNEKLLFLSKYDQIFVPGFDGIVYSQDNEPIANYSLKGTDYDWRGATDLAISKAYHYSLSERPWFNSLTGQRFAENRSFSFQRDRWPNYYEHTFKSIVYLTRILGVKTSKCDQCRPRRTRVVVHVYKVDVAEINREDIAAVQKKIAEHRPYIESVTLMNRGKALEIFENQVRLVR